MSNYPTLKPRIEYDQSGSRLYVGGTEQATTQLVYLNSEDPSQSVSGMNIVVLLPEAYQVTGFALAVQLDVFGNPPAGNVYTSSDAVDGSSGSYSDRGSLSSFPASSRSSSPQPCFRQPATVSWPSVRAVKLVFTDGTGGTPAVRGLFLFGTRVSMSQYLRLWAPTTDVALDPDALNYGDIPQGSTEADRQFRVKNASSTLTAKSVRVAMDVLYDAVPPVATQLSLSKDGGSSYGAQQTLGDMAPGALSTVIRLRRQTSLTAALSLWSVRLFAEASSWE